MDSPTVTVIIPAYNVAKYLGEALGSISRQLVLPDEIILIDDGSTDVTLQIAESFEIRCPYIVLSIQNKGQGNARNLGLSLARSEYVYFFDADDLLSDKFIAEIKGSILKYERPDIVLFSGRSFNDPEYTGTRWIDYRRGFSGVFGSRCEFLEQAAAARALFCSPCLYVSRREVWSSRSLKFGGNYFEDDAIFLPLLFFCESFAVIDKVYFFRRNRPGSTVTMETTAMHVRGARDCTLSTLGLMRGRSLSGTERALARNRLVTHFACYFRLARDFGTAHDFELLGKVVGEAKSLRLGLLLGFYALRVDKLNFLGKPGRWPWSVVRWVAGR